MTYEQWDKTSPVNGVEAIDLIGQEQMENDDIFLLFKNESNEVIAIESVNTMKAVYGFIGETVEEIAEEYILRHSTSFQTLKELKLSEIKHSCEQAIFNGFEYNGNLYEYDLKDQSRFQSTMIAIQMGMTGTVVWATKSGIMVEFTNESFPLLFQASLVHMQTMIAKSRLIEEQIIACTTPEELELINWN